MAKETVMQVRMDSQTKTAVEELYKSLGTSFTEAVRVFAAQSIIEHGYPFTPKAYHIPTHSARGILSQYASETLRQQEAGSFERAMVTKHV